ncbi:ureidoglycolate lyase [Planctomycetaceae bacterium SH139]
MTVAPNYLAPELPSGLERVALPVVPATAESLGGYGRLLDHPDDVAVEIVRWPAQGWRPVDEDSGNEGGTTEGSFTSRWSGDVLYGVNEAVGGRYILGFGKDPAEARKDHQDDPAELLLWHANYHPDGGQLFFPVAEKPFLVPLALPGDDVQPSDFVCFLFSGQQGLYIHPNIWHDGVYALQGEATFFGRQGAVHARVSVDFAREFRSLLRVDLRSVRELLP